MKETNEIIINHRPVGDGYPAYLIAEMSANHSGSLARAKEIIRIAKVSGADCVKIQTYTPDTLTIDSNEPSFQVKNGTWEGENLYSLYQKAYTPWEWHEELFHEAKKVGIDFFSTPFDKTSVDFLEDLGMTFYKIASFELVDLPLLRYVASKGKPMILSTGMATLEEIKEAVRAIKEVGNHQFALLKCSSSYPAVSDQMNLRTITDLKERFLVPIGLSDHSLGSIGAVTAVALGASIIEKHFCLSRQIPNPDASFSMEPDEYAQMEKQIRQTQLALGSVYYGATLEEESSLVFRRSLFIVQDIQKGERFNETNLRIIRPGYGEKPKYSAEAMGMVAAKDIKRGTPFSFDCVKAGSILFLTNNPSSRILAQWLTEHERERNIEVYIIENRLSLDMVRKLQPLFLVSFNYRHLISKDVLEEMDGRAINLHTSYLPYNRGASPNFFSFLDDTPKGVTLHQLAAGLDKGDIYAQTQLLFDETKETFVSTYDQLQAAVRKLFMEKWDDIREGRLPAVTQIGNGTYHTYKELKDLQTKHPFSWEEPIVDVLKRISDKVFNLRGRRRDN